MKKADDLEARATKIMQIEDDAELLRKRRHLIDETEAAWACAEITFETRNWIRWILEVS